jgi:hypothetical protein
LVFNNQNILIYMFKMGLAEESPTSAEEKELYLPSLRVQINNTLKANSERFIQMRLLCLIRSVSMNQAIQILLNYSQQSSSKIKTLHRVRALSVLFQLASPSDLEQRKVHYNELRYSNYLLNMF